MQTAYINGAACIGRIHVDSDNLFLRQQVVSALKNLCIPFNHWGTYKQSRSIGKLVEYLKTGEVIWDGTSDTHVIPVSVGHVRFIKNRQLIELRDVGQIFRNGHEHKRSFSGTFGEKIMTKKGEDGIATVRRGLKEELGQKEPSFANPENYDVRFIEFREQGPEESEYWPGLPHHRQEERFKVIYTREIFRVFIKPCLYHDEYVLSEHDKTTVFRWVPIEPDFIEQ